MDTEAQNAASTLSLYDSHTLENVFNAIFKHFPDAVKIAIEASKYQEPALEDITLASMIQGVHNTINKNAHWVAGMKACSEGRHSGEIIAPKDSNHKDHVWCKDCENIVGNDLEEYKRFISTMAADMYDSRKVMGLIESGEWAGAFAEWSIFLESFQSNNIHCVGHLDTNVRDGFGTGLSAYMFVMNGYRPTGEKMDESEAENAKQDPMKLVEEYLNSRK